MTTRRPNPLLLGLAALLLACGTAEAETPALQPQSQPQSQSQSPGAAVRVPARAEAPVGGMPQLDEAGVDRLGGVVDQVEPAGPYTYVRLDEASGGHWVVVMGGLDVEAGDSLTFEVYGSRTRFHSRRLGRELDELYFGRLASPT